MFEIEVITSKNTEEYDNLVKFGLQNYPAAFETDFSQLVNRPIHKVIGGLKEIGESSGFLLGAFSPEGKLIGTVLISPRAGPKILHRADLFFLFVHTKYQYKGVGELLINKAIDRSKTIAGLEQLELTVSTDCQNALSLYKKVGFQITGSFKRQTKIGDVYHDYVAMWRPLRGS